VSFKAFREFYCLVVIGSTNVEIFHGMTKGMGEFFKEERGERREEREYI